MWTPIEEAITEIQNGKMLIVVDDEDRENEGDLVMAAESVTKEAVNFMMKEGRGLICTPITASIAKRLNLSPMTGEDADMNRCNFTVSVDYKAGTSTGISAGDRAQTVRALVDENSKPEDFLRPGHIFPVLARKGGVLVRAGHTEAAVDLARLAGCTPAGVICEVLDDEGRSARGQDLQAFAATHRLTLISVEDVRRHRLATEALAKRLTTTSLPTTFGRFNLRLYKDALTNQEHLALTLGDVTAADVLCRVHSRCVTGDVFGSRRCDCQQQLHTAMTLVQQTGRGIILYLDQEGRGIGLTKKIAAYALQDQGVDTVEANLSLGFKADLRDYGIGAQILADLGVRNMRLLTNNPKKMSGLESYGLKVVETIPIIASPNPHNHRYLETKQKKMGHLLNLPETCDN